MSPERAALACILEQNFSPRRTDDTCAFARCDPTGETRTTSATTATALCARSTSGSPPYAPFGISQKDELLSLVDKLELVRQSKDRRQAESDRRLAGVLRYRKLAIAKKGIDPYTTVGSIIVRPPGQRHREHTF